MKKFFVILFVLFFASTAFSLTVNLSATPPVVDVGDEITFTAVITRDGTETQPYNFTFDFGDGIGTGTDVITNETDDTIIINYTYIFTDADNEFTALVNVSDSTGLSASDTIDIEVYNLQVTLTTVPAAPAEGDIPFTVDFTVTALDGAPNYVFEWDYGDGTTETENSFGTSTKSHDYLVQDTFTAKITVTDRRLKSVEATVTVIATVGGNAAPIAEANGPYQKKKGVSFNLDSTGSGDSPSASGPGGITNHTWVLEIQAGNPQCTFDLTGTDTISGNGVPHRMPAVTCNDIGTVKVTLTVTDGPGATDSDTATIKINPTQTTDKVNIVKMWVEPEIVGEGVNLKIFVRVRNETNQTQTFDLNYQVKENIPDANISALPNLIPNLELLSQSVDGYKQKDFEITIPAASISSNLDPQKNYWVYARAEVAGENNTMFNTRRAIFNYNAFKKVQIPEINFIGVLTVLLFSLIILKNRKR